MRLARLLPASLALAAASVAGRATAAPGDAPWFEYGFAPAADLSTMTVTMTFHGEPAKRLVLDDGAGAEWIGAAPGGEAPAASPAGGYVLAGTSLTYSVDLERLQSREGGAYRVGRDLVTRVGRWLLRPAVLPAGSSALARFRLPAGVNVATPWATTAPDAGEGATYLVDATAFAFWGWVAFGRFTVDRFAAAGTAVEVAVLDGSLAATPEGIRRWLTAAVDAVAALYGGSYPRKKLTAFVEPSRATRGDGDPVSFGATWPGGGGLLVLHLPSDSKDARLPGEWVATHELVHLAMPVVVEEDAWFSEGVATYYQEVLRMRSGHFREADGWRSLLEGFAYGGSRPPGVTLREASKTMRATHAYSWTYWAGAAAVFRADVALRARAPGAGGLDDAMRLWARLVGGEAAYGADALCADAEAATGRPGIAALTKPALDSKEFPDLGPTLADLGIPATGETTLSDAAPQAAVRRAIAAGAAPARAPGPDGPPEPRVPGAPR